MQNLPTLIKKLRVSLLKMIAEAKSGHPGGSLSAIDLMSVLWFHILRGNRPQSGPERDRFILSKGHAVPALYAILAELGHIEPEELATLRKMGSRLQGHPDRVRLPIMEASTGSLGQGLSVAQGLAMGLRHQGLPSRVFCLLGDGEIQEGQVWESALSCAKYKLSNLCAIIDANNGQIDGKVSEVMPLEPLSDKWRAFGWEVREIDGHDLELIEKTFQEFVRLHENRAERPFMIIARTIKGKGVSFMENRIEWHGVAPKADELARAIEEIQK